jgi:hypothetical protein
MCGIAKDLTKLGGKTVTKLVTPGACAGSFLGHLLGCFGQQLSNGDEHLAHMTVTQLALPGCLPCH